MTLETLFKILDEIKKTEDKEGNVDLNEVAKNLNMKIEEQDKYIGITENGFVMLTKKAFELLDLDSCSIFAKLS